MISSSNGSRSEQERRIGIAATTMKSLAQVWKAKKLKLRTKLRLYTSLVVSVLLYASDTWTMTKADLSRLQSFHMSNQRKILGVHWYDRVKNTEIQRRTNLPHIGSLIQRRRYSLFGHVVRMQPDAPAHSIMKLASDITIKRRLPNSWKRPRGRPRSTWLGQIRKDNGLPLQTSWSRASNRVVWLSGATALQSYAVQ